MAACRSCEVEWLSVDEDVCFECGKPGEPGNLDRLTQHRPSRFMSDTHWGWIFTAQVNATQPLDQR